MQVRVKAIDRGAGGWYRRAVGASTAEDGRQRALDRALPSLEDLLALRLEVRDALAATPTESPLRHVLPWIWQPSSLGAPLTSAGDECGMELRLSRYATPRYRTHRRDQRC